VTDATTALFTSFDRVDAFDRANGERRWRWQRDTGRRGLIRNAVPTGDGGALVNNTTVDAVVKSTEVRSSQLLHIGTDGTELWATPRRPAQGFTILRDGPTVFLEAVGDHGQLVTAIDYATGRELWRIDEEPVPQSMALGSTTGLFTNGCHIWAVDPTSALRAARSG
jgi:outer membrane protein assembly factor BamB